MAIYDSSFHQVSSDWFKLLLWKHESKFFTNLGKTDYVNKTVFIFPGIYSEVPFIEPGCNFPQNFSGTYYMGGDYDNDLTINNTHIYKYVHLTQYQYLETYFICMQHADSWYLVFTIDVGKW